MEYRRLGRAGLRVSVLSYGTWLTFAEQGDFDRALQCLDIAGRAGVNLFDTADAYGAGEAERLLGLALETLGWDRAAYVLATKLFAGTRDCVNMRQTLNRKYLLQGIDDALDRLRTDFVDLLYCHCPDPHTPMEEIVWTMSDIVARGKAHYWGTSGWSPAQIGDACAIADRHHLRKPTMEQSEYHLLARNRIERDGAAIHREHGIGLTTWSPLASGLLTGKYAQGVPRGSRATVRGCEWLQPRLCNAADNQRVQRLQAIARRFGASAAQLAIAWCMRNPAVASITLGASSTAQLHENLAAVALAPLLDSEVMRELDALFPTTDRANTSRDDAAGRSASEPVAHPAGQ
jgi:voltage-dependent potassium channel beta subunit